MMNEHGNVNHLLSVLAERVRARRAALGLTQEQLAELAGMSTNFLARMEMAGRTPSFSTLARLADALEVHVSDLLTEDHVDLWRDEAVEIAHALGCLDKADAALAVDLLRSIVGHLKQHHHH